MHFSPLEFMQIAQGCGAIITAIAAITGATLGFLNREKIKQVAHATNSLLDQRVAAAHDVGRIAERTEQAQIRAAADAQANAVAEAVKDSIKQ